MRISEPAARRPQPRGLRTPGPGVLPVLFALLAGAAGAAEPTPLDDYFRQVWTTRDGLPHNSINAMVQGPEGYLWFATWEGVSRFNGRDFVTFERGPQTGLPDSSLRAMHLDPAGRIWIGGSRGGLVRVERGQWTAFPPLGGQVVSIHVDASGAVWVGTQNDGLTRIDADGRRRRWDAAGGLGSDSVAALHGGRDGRVWIGTGAGLAVAEGEAIRRVELDAANPGMRIFALARDAEDRLLVGSERGLYRALPSDGAPPRFERILTELSDTAVTALLRDREGSLWVGTLNRGLFRLSARGLERLGVAQGLPNNRVLSLLEDREGSVWVGTNGGLFRVGEAPFTSITRSKGLSDDYVRAVLAHSDGSLWVGTSQGLNRILPPVVEHLGRGSALGATSVLSLAEARDGSVWAGTFQSGALRIRDGVVAEAVGRAEGLPANEVRSILLASDDTLWMGTPEGLARFRDGAMRVFGSADGLPDDYVFSVVESHDGAIWVGTGVGAAVIEDGRLRRIEFGVASDAETVFHIHDDPAHASVWLVSDRGLIRYRRPDRHLGVVGREQGLPFDKWFHLVDDGRGAFWLTSNRGVVRIDAGQARAVADGREDRIDFEVFGESEGMASAQCNGGSTPAAALAHDGSLWVATAMGVATVQPARLDRFVEQNPAVVIEDFVADGVAYDFSRALTLPAGTSRIDISFAGLAFRMPGRVRYRYRLQGFDRTWIERGSTSYAEFTNLPPGDYRFRVQAAQAHGGWGHEETTLTFSVAPFLWQRPWFQTAVVLGVVLLVAGYTQARVNRHRSRQRRLQALVDQRTAELRDKSELLARQAREDALTGLTNRRAFDENLAREFARAKRHASPLCLALLDIDRFKQINDRYSHAVGDEVLKAVAAEMRRLCRDIDLVSRWGGEEFALLFPDTRPEDARAICERLRQALQTLDLGMLAPGLGLSASIGIASHADVPDHDRLVARADAALYRAKQGGRNRVEGP
jgi:diguanylate cyclase (GGDEF)-like protein